MQRQTLIASQAWGIAISATVLQNQLLQKLPAQVLGDLPSSSHAALIYGIIPKIGALAPELQRATQQAFVDSMRLVWIVMVAISGAGILTVIFIREFPLNKTTDKNWGLKEKEMTADREGQAGSVDEQDDITMTALNPTDEVVDERDSQHREK